MKLERLAAIDAQVRPEALRLLLGALIVLLLLGAHLYLLGPSLERHRELRAARAEDSLGVVEGRAAAAEEEIARLERELVALDEALYGGSSRLPVEQIESHVIDRLDRLSGSREVQLVSVAPGGAGEVLGFDELPFEVSVEGDYFALYEWLGVVEEELRPMIVKHFEMRPLTRSDRVAMKLLLVSYRPREEPS